MKKRILPICITTSVFCAFSYAEVQVATVTQVEGNVKIFSHPSKSPSNDSSIQQALYEGEYFQISDAHVGDKIEKGNLLRTLPGGKARVVYENGDQINVGSGTAYKVSWEEKKENPEVNINLAYGKLRGIVAKGGPRSHLSIKTKTAVMGVRGTDFFVAQGGADGTTEVAIIRGKVDVTPLTPKAKTQSVESGFSAEVAAPTGKENAMVNPQVELRKTTQEDLMGIQKSSTIHTEKPKADEKIAALESKATETALKDIAATNQKLYASLEGKKITTLEEINQAAVQSLIPAAPKAPAHRKPHKAELENIEDGAYERYFKVVRE